MKYNNEILEIEKVVRKRFPSIEIYVEMEDDDSDYNTMSYDIKKSSFFLALDIIEGNIGEGSGVELIGITIGKDFYLRFRRLDEQEYSFNASLHNQIREFFRVSKEMSKLKETLLSDIPHLKVTIKKGGFFEASLKNSTFSLSAIYEKGNMVNMLVEVYSDISNTTYRHRKSVYYFSIKNGEQKISDFLYEVLSRYIPLMN